jgi:ribonuclease P protein component
MLRIKQKKLFDRLRHSQKKIYGNNFLFVYIEDGNNSELAVGITVSKKVGNAVTRNLIKRRVKAVLNGFQEPAALSHFYINIIAKPDVTKVNFASITQDITYNLNRLTNYALIK